MSEIQVNTNDLYNGSQNLKAAADEIGNIQNQVGSATVSVGNSYNGQLRQAIEGIVGGSAQTGTRLQNRASQLGEELFNRASGFESANQAAFSSLSSVSSLMNGQFPDAELSGFSWLPPASDQNRMGVLFGMAGITGLTGISLITTNPPKLFSSSNFTLNGLKDSVDLLADGMSRSGFREIGRNLNKLVGNKKAGFVGFMDETGGLLKKNKGLVTGVTSGVSFALGVSEDLANKDNLSRALGSEAIELGMNLSVDGAFAVASSFVPVVGQAYLVYKAVMLISDAAEGGLRVAGMNEAADVVKTLSDSIDLSEYTDKFANNIYDYIANPANQNAYN